MQTQLAQGIALLAFIYVAIGVVRWGYVPYVDTRERITYHHLTLRVMDTGRMLVGLSLIIGIVLYWI